jgi:hypothetical protein
MRKLLGLAPFSFPGHALKEATATSVAAPYFVNAPFDCAFVGGLSLVTYCFVRLFGSPGYSERAMLLSIWLMWGINWPHFSATIFRLFRTRENASQYPVTVYGVPILIAAGAVGALLSPQIIAPFFVKVFLLWSPYHFSGQSMGVSLIYARRSGVRLGRWQRLALATFIFGTYGTSTLRAETSLQGASYYGIAYPGLGVPLWMPVVAAWGMWLGAIVFVAFAVGWSIQHRRPFPGMVVLPGLTQYVWFMMGAELQAFYVFVPFFHSLQYLPIAWAMQLGERQGETHIASSPHFVISETLRWAAINLVGGVALFYGLPHAVAWWGVDLNFATGVLISAVQIHHFCVDGVIWKLRHTRVASPLLANVRAYLRATPHVSTKVAA